MTSAPSARAILSGEVLHLYRSNPFRVLNLASDATMRQAEKQVQRINVMRQMGKQAADEFAVREAMQTLRDPQRRLLAELFWFQEGTESEERDAMAALRAGRWQQARATWTAMVKSRPDDVGLRSLHNVAVLLHARVVALETGKNDLINRLAPSDSLPTELIQEWHTALRAWSLYWRSDVAWEFWRARAVAQKDRRITERFADELRASLPESLLLINRDLARRYADARLGTAASAHCRIMRESGFDADLVQHYGRSVIDPIKDRLLEIGEEFQTRLREAKKNKKILDEVRMATEYTLSVRDDLTLLSQLDPTKAYGAQAGRESVARALHSAAISAGLDVQRRHFAAGLELVSKALRVADSATLRADILDTQKRIQTLQSFWTVAPQTCLLCAQPPGAWYEMTRKFSKERRLAFLCDRHDENHDEDVLLTIVSTRWKQLPIMPPGYGEDS